jgi:pilus assembly protein CpaB
VPERKVTPDMDRRRLLLILAIFVAVIGTALVFLYVKGADNRAQAQFDNVGVLKATSDIAAGDTFDAALAAGRITLQDVPKNQVEVGAQTTTTALKGKIVSVPIFTGQQVIASQFGNTVAATASSLAIPKGMIAISVNLTDPDRVAGNIQPGSTVAIFVTDGGGPEHPLSAAGGTSTATNPETALLLPKVTVLNVGSPVPVSTTTTDTTGAQTTETLPKTLLTIAVNQKQAQKVILSSKHAVLTFGLLTGTSTVQPNPGTTFANLFK